MRFQPRFLAALALALLAAGSAARAQQVTTVLSSPTTQVGVPVQLQYQFANMDAPRDMPRTLMVDGLDVRLTGTSRRVEMVNMQTSSTMIYAYTVVANRPGEFTIPGFAVQAGGRQLRTDPVRLRVGGGGSMPAPSGPPGMRQIFPPPQAQPQRPVPQRPQQMLPVPQTPGGSGPSAPRLPSGEPAPYFGELVMGAKRAYVGEVVPVELRYYFRADGNFDNLQRPSFSGDGFTAANLSEPEQSEQIVDDYPYNVVTFRTAITPVKTGDIEIPAAKMQGRMLVPGGGSGLDPFFDQFFQNFPVPGLGRTEDIAAETAPRRLSVEPLPKEGKPANFSGAIGQFTIKAAASPSTVKSGEPVTLKLTVEGRGNFDAMGAPDLVGADGWRTYAPKETFNAADAIGYGGAKTFEISMVARQDQTQTPGAEFSYFDPLKKKYEVLKAAPVAVTAPGSSAAAAEPASRTGATTPSAPAQAPAPPAAADIAPPAATLSGGLATAHPWLLAPWFPVLNLALLLALVVLVLVLVAASRRRRKSEATRRLEGSLRAARDAMRSASDRAGFYGAAGQFVQSRLALLDARPAELIDPVEALERRVSDPVERREVRDVLARRDELKYGGGGAGALEPGERERVLKLLEKLASNHA